MSHSPVLEDKTVESSKSVKHCRSCWREDIHVPVPIPAFLLGFLTVMTLGLALFARPSRCVCCGKHRIF